MPWVRGAPNMWDLFRTRLLKLVLRGNCLEVSNSWCSSPNAAPLTFDVLRLCNATDLQAIGSTTNDALSHPINWDCSCQASQAAPKCNTHPGGYDATLAHREGSSPCWCASKCGRAWPAPLLSAQGTHLCRLAYSSIGLPKIWSRQPSWPGRLLSAPGTHNHLGPQNQ